MSKESIVDSNYKKPSKPKIKKFNLLQEKIENGWEKIKAIGYQKYKFGFRESVFVLLAAASLIYIGIVRQGVGIGFFNVNYEFLINGVVPIFATLFSVFLLSEVIYFFLFLFGRIRKLKFWSETIPFKLISWLAAGAGLVVFPIASLLLSALIPFALNYVLGNWIIKQNFDDRTRYYVPEEFEVPNYIEPEKMPQKEVKTPSTFVSADISGPKIMGETEYLRACDSLIKVLTPDDGMGPNIEINLPKLNDFLNRWF